MFNALFSFFSWYWSSWVWLVPFIIAIFPIILWFFVKRMPNRNRIRGKSNVKSRNRS